MKNCGRWGFLLCGLLGLACDGRQLGLTPGELNMRGNSTGDRNNQPEVQDGAADQSASRSDALGEMASDAGVEISDIDATPSRSHEAGTATASCADIQSGIFVTGGMSCMQLDSAMGPRLCVSDPLPGTPHEVVDFVGCLEASQPNMFCKGGTCCRGLLAAYYETQGVFCVDITGYQIMAYGKALDTDQDFVPDYRDNCPTVDNSFGQNDDDDHDGIGNACDPCPEVPGVTCADAGAY